MMNAARQITRRSFLSHASAFVAGIALTLAALVAGPPASRAVKGLFLLQRAKHSISLAAYTSSDTNIRRYTPSGIVECDGTVFRCNGGVLRARGLSSLRKNSNFVSAVFHVPINLRGSRIHLLHAAENCQGLKTEVPYGRVRLHYENGEARHVDLLHKMHGRDWWLDLRKATAEDDLLDLNTKLGWECQKDDGVTVRLYHTMFENPLPGQTISHVDFLSGMYEPNLMVYGFAVDDDSRPIKPAVAPEQGGPGLQSMAVELQDENGRSLPQARMSWRVMLGRGGLNYPDQSANSQGRVFIDVPVNTPVQVRYSVTAPGGYAADGAIFLKAGEVASDQVIKLASGGSPGSAPINR